MIDLGESKKITAVIKPFNFFLNAWSCLEFLEIIFTYLQSLIHRTQDNLSVILTVTHIFTALIIFFSIHYTFI